VTSGDGHLKLFVPIKFTCGLVLRILCKLIIEVKISPQRTGSFPGLKFMQHSHFPIKVT